MGAGGNPPPSGAALLYDDAVLPPSRARFRPRPPASPDDLRSRRERGPGTAPLRWRPALPFLVLALTACTGAAPPSLRGAPAALPQAEVPDLAERGLLLLMADRLLYEPYSVERALAGGPDLRRELAVTLGRVGSPRGRRVLEGLLLDEAAPVRRAAAFALGELGEAGAEEALAAAVDDPDREVGVLAVEALGKLGASLGQAVEAAAELEEAEQWARLLPHLFRFSEEAAVRLAVRGLAVPDPELRARAAYALAREPRPEAAPVLRSLLTDVDPRVRAWAARALGMVGEGADAGRLAALLEDPEPGPVIQALRAAARLVDEGRAAPPEAFRPRLVELLADPRTGVRGAALEVAHAWLLDEELGAALVRLAATPEGWKRGPALVALARGGHPRARELAAAAAAAPDPRLRARAAEAAAHLAARGLLQRLRTDPEARVRAAALAARLEGTPALPAPRPERAADLAREALDDPDAGVRATALGWLAEHPVLPVEEVVGALVATRRDTTVETRLTAVVALAARGEAEPLERGRVVERLEELTGNTDALLRRAAAEGLAALGQEAPDPGPVATPLTAAAYREMVERTRRTRVVEVETRHGRFRLRLECPLAPRTCLSFLQLAGQGFYDGLMFHRVVPDFVVQGGDPRGDGWGGPGYTLRDEVNRLRFGRGVVGMAHAGAHTAGSQFFITLSEQPHLDGDYTAFGVVETGMEVVEQIAPGDLMLSVREVR